jgi:hypothetical protein
MKPDYLNLSGTAMFYSKTVASKLVVCSQACNLEREKNTSLCVFVSKNITESVV